MKFDLIYIAYTYFVNFNNIIIVIEYNFKKKIISVFEIILNKTQSFAFLFHSYVFTGLNLFGFKFKISLLTKLCQNYVSVNEFNNN